MGNKNFHQIMKETLDGSILDQHGQRFNLMCSNCNTKLAEVQVSRPNIPMKILIRAKCWKCGDHSYEKAFVGGFHTASTDESDVVNMENKAVDLNEELMTQEITLITQRGRYVK